jgi:hypothetical protein
MYINYVKDKNTIACVSYYTCTRVGCQYWSPWLVFHITLVHVLATGTCFIQKIYAPSSSLLQGKHLPFTPSPLRLNMFRLFVILSLTQLYRYIPEIFLFSTATFKYTYPPQTNWTRIFSKSRFVYFSVIFLMESALTSHGSSKSNKKPSDGRGISD